MIKVRPSGIKNKPFEVAEDSVVILSNGQPMFIQEYYPTDYASIPKILKLFLEYVGTEADAYIIHDYLYNYKGYRTTKRGQINKVSRLWADMEMYKHMKRLGSPLWRRMAYFKAVRLFGWLGFGKI